MPEYPPLPAGTLLEVLEFSDQRISFAVTKDVKQVDLKRRYNLEIYIGILLIFAGIIICFTPLDIVTIIRLLIGILMLIIRSVWKLFVDFPNKSKLIKSSLVRDDIIVLEPGWLNLTHSKNGSLAVNRNPITAADKACKYSEYFDDLGYAEFVSVTNGNRRINFGKELTKADRKWLIHRINEFLEKEHAEPKIKSAYKHVNEPLVFDTPKPDQDFREAILKPPPDVQVLRASENILRLKVRPNRIKSIGCAAFILVIIAVGVSSSVRMPFPLNWQIIGLFLILALFIFTITYNPIFATTYLSFDRQSRKFKWQVGFISRSVTLSYNACFKLTPYERLFDLNQTIEAHNNDQEPLNELYIVDMNKLQFNELVPNQTLITKKWLKEILNQYVQEESLKP